MKLTLDLIHRNFTLISPEYEQFARQKDACQSCSLYDHYKHVGQSEGNALSPSFMFVGEALGAEEVEQGRPFIGRAGQRLRAEMRKHPATFNRLTTLISNVLPCRPPNNEYPSSSKGTAYTVTLDNEGSFFFRGKPAKPQTKKVTAPQLIQFCCNRWLFREIRMLRPKVLVLLGSKSLEAVRGVSGIGQHRGSWSFVDKLRVWSFATYHPSYVLRCQNDPEKEFVVEEFQQDIAKISESWATITAADTRLSMSDEEWSREQALSSGIDLKMYKEQPIGAS